MTAHFHQEGSMLAGTTESFCDRFEIELSLDSDEPPAAIAEALRISHRACFTEHALTHTVTIDELNLLNSRPLEL